MAARAFRALLAVLALHLGDASPVVGGFFAADDGAALLQTRARGERKDNCIIHYHIGKTAGTSIKAWFRSHGMKTCDWNGHRIDNTSLSQKCLHAADFYSGHWGIGLREFLAGQGMTRNCYEFTVLRNPMDRTASKLFYAFSNETMDFYINEMRRAFVSNQTPASSEQLINHMCRQFSGKTHTFDEFSPHYADDWRSKCDLKLAMAALRSMDFVGFVEDLDRVLQFLASVSWVHATPGSETAYRDNPSGNPGARRLPKELQDLILSANDVDMQLYEWARHQANLGQSQ